jgi:hypothetical protein
MAKKWIQDAVINMATGTFSNEAKKKGKSTLQYANEIIKKLKGKTKTDYDRKMLRRAVFAKNLITISKKN